MMALGMSLLVNLVLVGAFGFYLGVMEWTSETVIRPKSTDEVVTTVYIDPVRQTAAEEEVKTPAQDKPFARTSPDQPESTEKTNERIGERSTQATSENPADPNADALPSQSGIEPRENEIETTESRFQDGELTPSEPTPPNPDDLAGNPSPASQPSPLEPGVEPTPLDSVTETPPETTPLEAKTNPQSPPLENTELKDPTISEESSPPPARETLLQGPNSVEVKVPEEVGESERPKETPERSVDPPTTDGAQTPSENVVENPPAKPGTLPKPKSFKGFQRKTAMVGSISRTGKSSLNVDDTELGRYQAAISKAVELQWQRNCIRHRDFITPGFLTVRFFVEPSGRVKSVSFVGQMETGEVQKGFTLTSIREADIPKMPQQLAEIYEGDTLELVFRFYF